MHLQPQPKITQGPEDPRLRDWPFVRDDYPLIPLPSKDAWQKLQSGFQRKQGKGAA